MAIVFCPSEKQESRQILQVWALQSEDCFACRLMQLPQLLCGAAASIGLPKQKKEKGREKRKKTRLEKCQLCDGMRPNKAGTAVQ